MADAVDASGDPTVTREDPRPMGVRHYSFVADKEIVKQHAQLRGPEIKAHGDAKHAPLVEGANAAISASTADECNKAFSRELSGETGEVRAGFGSSC